MKKCPKVAYVLYFYHLSFFSLYGQPFSRYEPILKISIIFGHEIWNLKKGPKVAYVHSFYPRGSKISLFLLYGQPFSRFSKLPYFGMKSRTWKKCRKLHMDHLSTPGGRNWAYFCSTGSGFRDTGRFSKLPYLGMKPGIWKKCRKLHMDLLSTPGDRN